MQTKRLDKNNADFPKKLQNSGTSSVYALGDLSLLSSRVVGIVGSREADRREKNVAEKIGGLLAQRGFTIASRMEKGDEKASLDGALAAGGKCIVVQPGGFRHIYPEENKELLRMILHEGGLALSAYPLDEPVMAYQFPSRDELFAASCDGIVIVSSSETSHAMRIVRLAHSLSIPVTAFSDAENGPSEGVSLLLDARLARPFSTPRQLLNGLQKRK